MKRSDYGFQPLTYAQYEQIVSASEMGGRVSPMHGEDNFNSLMDVSQEFDIDPRVALAWTLWEDHDGTDLGGGIALAKVYNFGGIKWAGQDGAYDSGIEFPHKEGIGPMGTYTYAGFDNFGGFVRELYRTLNNKYCGPYFTTGDLANAASVYIRGKANSGVGQERVDTFLGYQRKYPAAAPVGVK